MRFAILALVLLATGNSYALPLWHSEATDATGFAPLATHTSNSQYWYFPSGTAAHGYQYDLVVSQNMNEAYAYSQYVTARTNPGYGALQLGVFAQGGFGGFITTDGKPLDPSTSNPTNSILPTLPYGTVSANASYQDSVTFLDPSLPLGAPLHVTLGYYAGSWCHQGLCTRSGPAFGGDPDVISPYTLVSIATYVKEVGLGAPVVSEAHVYRENLAPGAATSLNVGIPLEHAFDVVNGGTYEYFLAMSAVVSLNLLGDPQTVSNLARDFGTVKTWGSLDYLGTLGFTEISATDANGNPLAGFAMKDSMGWLLQASVTPPVPEASQLAGFAALLLATLARRRARAPSR